MKILFREKQSFNTLWSSLFFLPLFLVLLSFTYARTHSPYLIGAAWLAFALVFAVVYFSKLETQESTEGITLRFFPFLLRQKHIPWSEVQKAHVREYLPLSEYGGWGAPLVHPAVYRGMGNSRALTTRGREGLQLHLADGRFLLIGTQKRAELESVIQNEIRK